MPVYYEIRVAGRLDPGWSEWLEGMTVTALERGGTLLSGQLADQSALHGLLNRLRDLNLELLRVEKKADPGE